MERQTSFSLKPIRFLVFYFSSIFLIFFSICVFKTITSSLINTHSILFNTSSVVTVHSLRGFNTSTAPKKSILKPTHLTGDEVSSKVGNFSSFEGAQKSKNSLLTGNLSLTSFGEVPSVDDFQELDDSVNSSTTSQELNDVIVSDISSGGENNSIRNTIEEKGKVICDITKGRWVIDESYPLYTNADCPFIDEGFNCEANGRLDKDYMKWRWHPQDCKIPRNQWESMLCLLMRAVKDPKKVYETRGRKITKEKGNYCFKFEDYKCTVEYYVTHFLVHESKARIGKKRVQTLRIDTIDKGSSKWRGADILVFNTAHWWSHHKIKAGINYYQEKDQVHPQLDVTKAFQRALSTWASWVDKYINPHKTRIFFRSSAPSHFSGGLWNNGGHCKEAFEPINKTALMSEYPEKNLIVEEIIRQMKNPVTFLNITSLSDYRPDGHPSIYGRSRNTRRRGTVEDCSHWCLPGVPDNWNELLYYYLQLRTNDNRFVD
ncbi:hypothetical protein RD792_009278 [Penstemon davidsonii]|uniref:Trichome birefringence-like N-terminal domain-containing protein n=1 Tax=Penstemon davidsonii TaxID=160366 RepID=A0ABR0CYK8_9LAMI|nr:hypothetical protein RD792_009278 [Penstemon davidsonii]